jgi:polyvinyl alcohol dehydrogenase (cytochrome)
VVALDIHTGKVVWKTYTMPDNGGLPGTWSGGAVISVPAADPGRGVLYVTSDHQYTMPATVAACLAAARDDWDPGCLPADARFDSLTALDLGTGAVKWSFFGAGADVWRTACGELPSFTYPFPVEPMGQVAPVRICPPASDYLDWSFAAGSPQLFQATIDGAKRDLVGLAEKSGVYWALDADTGKVVWHTLVGPYSEPGGLGAGAAFDGKRLYLALTNLDHVPHRLTSGQVVTGGSWAALDPASGKILWQVGDPQGAPDYAAPTVANGVVYVGSMAPSGKNMYALDAGDGKVLWGFASGGSVASNPAVAGGRVYWGSGLPLFGGTANDELYVFAVKGNTPGPSGD